MAIWWLVLISCEIWLFGSGWPDRGCGLGSGSCVRAVCGGLLGVLLLGVVICILVLGWCLALGRVVILVCLAGFMFWWLCWCLGVVPCVWWWVVFCSPPREWFSCCFSFDDGWCGVGLACGCCLIFWFSVGYLSWCDLV